LSIPFFNGEAFNAYLSEVGASVNVRILADRYLRRTDLPITGTDDRHRGSAVIDKAFLTGLVGLAHGALLLFMPVLVAITELRVAVTAVGILLGVLLPQQLLGHALALEFLVDK